MNFYLTEFVDRGPTFGWGSGGRYQPKGCLGIRARSLLRLEGDNAGRLLLACEDDLVATPGLILLGTDVQEALSATARTAILGVKDDGRRCFHKK